MAQDNWQKVKLLRLSELLRQETDEEHPMTTMTICSRMEKMGIPCERRVVARDIALLNEIGIEVMTCQVGKEKGYYVADRSFSVPELKILIDAVQASGFITEKKTEEFITKIAALGGTHRAEILKGNVVHFNTRKHSNESIYYNVDAIEQAILNKKKFIFRYFDLDMNGQKKYRRDGHHYVVEPVALVFNEDNYYAVTYSSRHDGTANYRVDRMDSVEMVDEDICEKALELRSEVCEYTEQAIKMYGGPIQTVVLEFDNKLTGAVYDRFGEGISMMEAGDGKLAASVKVQISPTFWGWLFQFGNKMKVISPESVKDEYNNRLTETAGLKT